MICLDIVSLGAADSHFDVKGQSDQAFDPWRRDTGSVSKSYSKRDNHRVGLHHKEFQESRASHVLALCGGHTDAATD